jgi:YVTN family beta-propeller protein
MSSSDGRTAYVTNEGSNDVSVVDLTSRTVMATIAVSNAPRKIAVLPGPGAAVTPAAQSRAAASPRGKSKSVTLGGVAYVSCMFHGALGMNGQLLTP